MRIQGSRSLIEDDDFDYKEHKQGKEKEKGKGPYITGPNKEVEDIIKEFITNKNKDSVIKVLYIYGDIGTGKSTIVKKCIEDVGMYYEEFNQEFDETQVGSHLQDVYRTLTNVDMSLFFGNTKSLVVIIKDFENSLKKVQQKELFDFVSKENIRPLILIGSYKKNCVLKSHTFIKTVFINKLETKDLLELAKMHGFNSDKTNELAIQSKGDIRHFLESLSMGSIRDYELDTKNKFKEIIKNGILSTELCSIYTNSVVYANYIKWNIKDNNIVSMISDMLTITDTINTQIYTKGLWDDYLLTCTNNILSTIYPINKTKIIKINDIKEDPKDYKDYEDYVDYVAQEESQGNEDIIENTKNSTYLLASNRFKYLSDLNYALRYIVDISEYNVFITGVFTNNFIENNQLKILCNGLSKEKTKEFKKVYKEILKEIIEDDD
jgi:hypothetical protein